MFLLFCRAYLHLLRADGYLIRSKFPALREWVHNTPRRTPLPGADATEAVCHAVDLAAVWYWKQVLCLQRSAATACLLRQCGVAARLVIGAQIIPLRAHAWVEVEGRIVNDKPYIAELYTVLDRC
jgi:hypothetical protein